MRHRTTPCFSLVLAALLLAPASLAAQLEPVFPGTEWDYVGRGDLADYGWSPQALQRTFEFVRDSSNTTGLVVVDRGRVVHTFGDIEELSYLASVRKSVLSILYGIYVENGTIDLDATLGEIGLDDVGGLLPIERRARIRDLITARSGVYHPASNSGDNLADAPERGSQQPGGYMLYSNWDFNAAGAVFEFQTGLDIYDALEQHLAEPLEFEDWDRSRQRKSGDLDVSHFPAYHMWISTRDMARIGLLMLKEGVWRGDTLVSPEWVDRTTSALTPLEEMNPVRRRDGYFGYGYMWWVWDGPRALGPFEGAFTARGAVGQWITVFPALDLVVAQARAGRRLLEDSGHRALRIRRRHGAPLADNATAEGRAKNRRVELFFSRNDIRDTALRLQGGTSADAGSPGDETPAPLAGTSPG